MSKTVSPIITDLFAGREKSSPLNFEWRLICRHGQPFLLLPCNPAEARAGLNLYSAQRRRAKIWRKCLPALFLTPAAICFERVRIPVAASSEFMQFLAQQIDVVPERVFPMAIKLSDVGDRSRLVLLLCDESGRPSRVIKVGLNAAGRAATDREADFLAQLPAEKIGCIRMTGRLTTPTISAFSTDYFPGNSPNDDAGLEHLFHDWINPQEVVALESLPIWRELANAAVSKNGVWHHIESLLAGKTVHTTLFHGDFTPWNVRVVNSRNLQAFDWERGSQHGIPGWDWFHFTIQTSILAKRYSAERVAVEVEQLIRSARFKKYAAAAGISDIVQPLVLAYLLHHNWVIKPNEGGRTTAELFDLLHAHWLKNPAADANLTPTAPAETPGTGVWATARRQLNFASRQWGNLFWEPSLNFRVRPSWRKDFLAHWPVLLAAALLFAAIGTAQYHSSTHIMFLPFFVAVCAILTWQTGRRWGVPAAAVSAIISPILVAAKDTSFRDAEVLLWNTVMRFIILEMCVLFVDRLRKHREMVHHRVAADRPPVNLGENWAVLLACSLYVVVIMILDYYTNPRLTFLPLYLFPCMVITLVTNLRWGVSAALLTAIAGTWSEYVTNKLDHYTPAEVFGWNFMMRLAISLVVIFMLHRIRKENFLFSNDRANGH